MQRHRAISHLFDTQHQFCPCDISNAAICNDIGDMALFGIHNTSFVLVIIISDAAICKDIGRYYTVLNTQHQFCPCDI